MRHCSGHLVANGTETLAIPQQDGSYRLYGYKWFSSATDSDMTLTLARVVDEDGRIVKVSVKKAASIEWWPREVVEMVDLVFYL